MSPGRRASLPAVFVCLLAAFTVLSPSASAQDQPSSNPQPVSGPQKPARKPDQVLNTDPVVLLAVSSVSKSDSKTAPRPVETPAVADSDHNFVPTETEKEAAEIASIEKQIQDKTKRIAFLIRLFVNDERPFLNDPANQKTDNSVQDRRKYEQDELLYETAELAKLKTRLNHLTAAH